MKYKTQFPDAIKMLYRSIEKNYLEHTVGFRTILTIAWTSGSCVQQRDVGLSI